MKKRLLLFILLPLIYVSGCLEALTGEQVGEIRTFSEKVDNYQVIVNELKEAFVADKIISEKTAENVDKITEWVDNAQPVLEKVATDVENAPKNIVSQMKAGATAASPLIPPPYNAAIIGILSVLEAFTVKKLLNKDKALVTEAGKRRSEKAGTEKTIRELAASGGTVKPEVVSERLFKNIGEERARNGFT
jgi:hypothetical protein